jgi:4-alpha-glucanotransferase
MAQWLVNSGTERAAAFRQFVASHAQLADYARFRATTERQRTSWPSWPQRLRSGTLKAGDYDPAAERYHQYAQWIAEEQMDQLAGRRNGGAGLYLDFPLGVHPHSYDVWRHREQFASQVSTGAPPDTLFRKGQNWGFPPPHPDRMRQDSYAYWIACLRHQFRHTGWLRLDHVMGLHRLFWIPEGLEARQGVYVRYPAEELYAILSLESHRTKTILVGEDLGTVPKEVTHTMQERGLKPMYVLQYEATPEAKACLRPVPATAVASLNTHDMPPFAAFWKGSDIREHTEIGMFDPAEAARQMEDRRKVRRALQQFLLGRTKPKASVGLREMFQACQEWLAASRAKMVLINLEDLWLESEPQNVPGTHRERPNWQRKARFSFEQFSRDKAIASLLQAIVRLRAGAAGRETPQNLRPPAPKS